MPTPSRPPVDPRLGDDAPTRYRAVLFILVMAAMVFFLAWLLNHPPGAEGTFNRLVLLPVSLYYATLSLALWRRRDWLHVISLCALFQVMFHLLGRVALALFVFHSDPDPRIAVALFSPWTPMFILGAFSAVPRRWAMRLGGLYVVLGLGIACAWLIQGSPPSHDPRVRYFLAQHFLLANVGYFGLASISMGLQESRNRARAEAERFTALAYTDPLTGLPNRRWLTETLDARLAHVPREGIAVLLCDLDHFKRVNDHFGHATGDAVLRAFGEVLRGALRGGDAVARWGGEEFVVVVGGADETVAMGLAMRLLTAVRARRFDGVERLTASIGIAVARPDEGLDALLERADAAMYAAKNQGRDRAVAAG